jgi:hypothetical protein
MVGEDGDGSLDEPVQNTALVENDMKNTTITGDDATGDGKSKELEDLSGQSTPVSREGTPPPLPPRRTILDTPNRRPQTSSGSLTLPRSSSGTRSGSRPPLQSKATTALSIADVHSQNHGNDSSHPTTPTSRQINFAGLRLGHSRHGSDGEETASVMSYAPTMEASADVESMLGDVLQDRNTPGWTPITPRKDLEEDSLFPNDLDFDEAFEHEFDELDDITSDGLNEGATFMAKPLYTVTDPSNRSGSAAVEGQAQAFSNPFVRRKTYLEQTWQ